MKRGGNRFVHIGWVVSWIASIGGVLQVRGIDAKVGLRMDVATRWNSTYVMLESETKYQHAFGCLAIRDRNYVHCPSNDEWKRAEKMCEFLKPFNVMTNLISGSSYPTSNHYFM